MTGNMNDRRAAVGATAHDDQSLGAALGRAIGAQVDAAAMPALLPPGVMADRARARVRIRTARRAVVAVAASVSVVFGSVVGWNALSRGATTTVYVTSAGPSTPSPPTMPRAEPEAPAPTLIEKDDGSQPAAGSPTPEDLSTGPVLEWTEMDPGFHDLFGFESAGDGRVIADAWPEGVEPVLWGETVVTEDGTHWETLPLPDGLIPEELDIAGDRWLVTGRYRNFDAPEGRLNRVFFSDDEGATWTELEFEVPPDPALAFPYLQRARVG